MDIAMNKIDEILALMGLYFQMGEAINKEMWGDDKCYGKYK